MLPDGTFTNWLHAFIVLVEEALTTPTPLSAKTENATMLSKKIKLRLLREFGFIGSHNDYGKGLFKHWLKVGLHSAHSDKTDALR